MKQTENFDINLKSGKEIADFYFNYYQNNKPDIFQNNQNILTDPQ